MQIKTDNEFKSLIPPLKADEYAQLETNIITDGCRDALVVWDGVLIDGHNRYEICTKHEIKFDTVEMKFDDRDDVILWICHNQLGRRNLPDYDRGILVLAMKPLIEAKARAQQVASGGDRKSEEAKSLSPKSDEPMQSIRTDETLADIAGVGKEKLRNIEFIHAHAAPGLIDAVRSGVVSISAAAEVAGLQKGEQVEVIARGEKEIIARANAMKREKKDKKKQEREEKMVAMAADVPDVAERYRLIEGDLLDVGMTLQKDSVDWIITDPPYPKEFLGMFDKLADIALHCLKPGGLAIVMIGQTYLPDIVRSLSRTLDYHWTLAYLTPGGQAVQQFQRKVNAFWKPVLVFSKGEYTGEWFGDVTKSDVNDNDKEHHYWGQSASGMRDLMKRFVVPGDVVLDPFLGGGTTIVVGLELGCHVIGIDIDDKAITSTKARIVSM